MTYNSQSFIDMTNGFISGRKSLDNVEMDVVNDVNTLSPLTMLRAYEKDESVDNLTELATQMLVNKEVRFLRNGQEVKKFFLPAGQPLENYFTDAPYLLDMCLKYCYGILLKKLTAPSNGSETQGQPSVK